jgi:hypothetical protein
MDNPMGAMSQGRARDIPSGVGEDIKAQIVDEAKKLKQIADQYGIDLSSIFSAKSVTPPPPPTW